MIANLCFRCFACWFGLLLTGGMASGGQVFGFGYPYGPVFAIDAVTGDTTVAAAHTVWAFGATTSSVPREFFITTVLNLWKGDLAGNFTALGAFAVFGRPLDPVDLARDSATNTLYAITSDRLTSELYTIDTTCANYFCSGGFISSLPAGIQGVDFVPGAGLYGVSNIDRFLYRMNPSTGEVLPVGLTAGIPFSDGVMDLAYDVQSRAFVAAVIPGVVDKFGLFQNHFPPPGSLYRIDRNTGAATLLSGNTVPMTGLAEDVPEPSTEVLVGSAALMSLLFSIRRTVQLRRSVRRHSLTHRTENALCFSPPL